MPSATILTLFQIAADGTVFSYGHTFFKGEIPSSAQAQVNPAKALQGAVGELGLPITADQASAEKKETNVYAIKNTSGAVKEPEARLVYFVKTDGSLELTWRVETDILSNWLLSYVSAGSNNVLNVVDWSADATYEV